MSLTQYRPSRRDLALIAAAEVGRAVLPGVRQAVSESVYGGINYLGKRAREGMSYAWSGKRRRRGAGTRGARRYKRLRAGTGGPLAVPGSMRRRSTKKRRTVRKKKTPSTRVRRKAYRTLGWQSAWEFNSVTAPAGTPDHVGVMQGYGCSSLLLVVAGAIWRKFYKVTGATIENPKDNVRINPNVLSLVWEYYTEADDGTLNNYTMTFTAGELTHEEVVIAIRNKLTNIFNNTDEQIRFTKLRSFLDPVVTNNFFTFEMDLSKLKIDIFYTSNAKIQNRTLGQVAGDDQYTDVTNNPLRVQQWTVRGNTIRLRSNPGVSGDMLDGEYGAMYNEDFPKPHFRVQKYDLVNSSGHKGFSLAPGAIMSSNMIHNQVISLNQLCVKMNKFLRFATEAAPGPDQQPAECFFGKSRFIQFNKVCSTGGQKINLGLDIQSTIGAYCRNTSLPYISMVRYA